MDSHHDSEDYAYYFGALAGDKPPMHPDQPQCGFYKARLYKDAPLLPVAIWRDRESRQLHAKIGYGKLFELKTLHDSICELWTWCCDKPVRYTDYTSCCVHHRWPDERNRSSDILELAEAILTESDDGGELESLYRKVEEARKAENRAHLDAKRLVDEKFKKITERIKGRMKEIKRARDAA